MFTDPAMEKEGGRTLLPRRACQAFGIKQMEGPDIQQTLPDMERNGRSANMPCLQNIAW